MPESGPSGSVRGALSNERPYRDYQATVAIGLACGVPSSRPRRRGKLLLTQDRWVVQDNRRARELAQSGTTGVASNNVCARNVTPFVTSTTAFVSFVTGRIAAGKR